MALGHGPTVVTNGLILALDAADRNSFDEYENIITNSEFEYLQLSGSTVATANQSFVPYGRNTAVNFNNNGGAGDTYIYRNFNTSLASGTKYVISVFSNSPTLVLGQGGLASGKFTQISSGSITLSNGWYRHWVSYSATVNNPNIVPQVVVAQGINVTLSGWQVETGTEITEYYPTTATTKTRGSTWIDLTGNGNTGTLTNGPTYSSANGGSLVFDGVDDYMQANVNTTALDGDPSLTVDMFVRRRTGTNIGGNAGFWGIGGAGQGNSFEGWTPTANLIHLDVYDSTRLATSQFYPEGTFVHIAWTKNGAGTETTNVKCYVNGVEVGLTKTRSATRTNQFNTSTNGVGICLGRINADANGFHAPIDVGSFKVYNRALSATEIQQNFNALRGRFGI